jgi:hypothetical protein
MVTFSFIEIGPVTCCPGDGAVDHRAADGRPRRERTVSFQITMMKLVDRMLALGPRRERRPPARPAAKPQDQQVSDYQTRQNG